MKIKLNSGEVVEERLNKAQRLIRLGKATVYIEPEKKVEPKKVVITENIESIFKEVKKSKKEKKSENKATDEKEYSTKKIPSWRNY
ncbi:MAG: hypothetical protein PHS34_08105 [Candidatus Omnitrophica bacterium]|nr:hypothetical protein [Candidatus Omnitrophota bacterium]